MSMTAEQQPMSRSATPQLAAELWISLNSLLRSHAAMYSIAAPGSSLRVQSRSSSIEIFGPCGKLSIIAPGTSGIGTTEFRPEKGKPADEYLTFSFTEDGLVLFEGADRALDMEATVERLLRKVQA